MRPRTLISLTMPLLLSALRRTHQPLSIARFVEATGAAASAALLSTRKLLNDGFITARTIDGIMHHELSGATPTATAVVRK